MASDRLKGLTGRLQKASASYGEAATNLSDQIAQFEDYLGSLSGKVSVTVERREPKFALTFTRRASGDKWCLYCRRAGSRLELLSTASVEAKVIAVELFESLLHKLLTVIDQRSAQLQVAIRSASDLLGKLELPGKEGA